VNNFRSWGANRFGQLGLQDEEARFEPNLLTFLADSIVLGAVSGEAHSMVLTDVGIVFSFGNNNFGQLGHFDTAHRSVPTRVRTLFQTMAVRGGCPDPKQRQHSDIIYSCVSQIAAGAFFSLALLETKPNSDPCDCNTEPRQLTLS